MRKAALFISFLLLAFWAGPAGALTVNVDAGKTLGPVPDLLTSSIWVQQINESETDMYRRFFRENRPATVQLSLPILAATRSFDDFKSTLRNYMSSDAAAALLNGVRSTGSTLIIGFDPCQMPAWLSSRTGDKRGITERGAFENWASLEHCAPPRDYALWADVVRHTLSHFRKDLKMEKLGYYVGHEQELQWAGSEAEFFTYYERTAQAVKNVGRDILVGGPGPAIWNKGKYGCDHLNPDIRNLCREQGGWKEPGNAPFLKNFIAFAGRKKVPLDFINLHSFGVAPRSFTGIADKINEWLASAGLTGTPLYISDWTSWDGPYPNPALDTSEAAAYIPQALYYMSKAGVNWHGHDFNVRNPALEKSGAQSTFAGDWPIFTKDHILKPSYNAFKALTLFGGNRERSHMLDARFPDNGNIVAFAAEQDHDRVAVLLSYFAPDPSAAAFKRSHLLEFLKQEGQFKRAEREIESVVDCVKNGPVEKGKAEKIEACMEEVLSGATPEKRRALEAVRKIVTAYSARDPEARLRKLASQSGDGEIKQRILDLLAHIAALRRPENVVLQVANLPFSGTVEISTYLIDDDNGNACVMNKKTGATGRDDPACGSGGTVDRLIADQKRSALRDVLEKVIREMERTGKGTAGHYKKHVDQCLSAPAIQDALGCLRDKLSRARAAGELKSDLKDVVREFNEEYAKRADAINDHEGVGLRASKRIVQIPAGKMFSHSVTLKPNTVLLMTAEKAGGR